MTRSDSELAVERANALYSECRFTEAVAVLDAALARDPDYWNAWAMKSIVHAQVGQYDAALQAAERAFALESTSGRGWAVRARALRAVGRSKEALAAVERAIALAPSLSGAHAIKASLLEDQRDYWGALECMEKALEGEPDDAGLIGHKGQILARLGDVAGAMAAFEEAHRLPSLRTRDQVAVWMREGTAFERLRRWTEAAEAYEQALAVAPAYLEALEALVRVEGHIGDWQATLEAVIAAQRAAPNEVGLWYQEARVLRMLRAGGCPADSRSACSRSSRASRRAGAAGIRAGEPEALPGGAGRLHARPRGAANRWVESARQDACPLHAAPLARGMGRVQAGSRGTCDDAGEHIIVASGVASSGINE